MKNRNSLFLLFFLLIPIFLIAGFLWWNWAISPVNKNDDSEKIFVIAKGENTQDIIDKLKNKGLIKNSFVFKIILKKEAIEGKIQAGDFHLSPSMNNREIAQELMHGSIDTWVTVPEGLRNEEIYGIFLKEGFDFDYFDWAESTKNKEGFLFPDTYLIPKQASPSSVIKIMNDNFNTKSASLPRVPDKSEVILASLIERETKTDKDRPIVAGIMLKRLENSWPLEIDATAQYALASQNCRPGSLENKTIAKCWWKQVVPADLKIDSPYNTYQNQGLPPAPICNPGIESIKAVETPKQSDYWFYISDKQGNMHYSETLEEHETNIEKYLN